MLRFRQAHGVNQVCENPWCTYRSKADYANRAESALKNPPSCLTGMPQSFEPRRSQPQGTAIHTELLMSPLVSGHPETLSAEDRDVPSAVNGPLPCRPPPSPLQRWLFAPAGPNATSRFVCPRSTRLAPRWRKWPLTYELLSKSKILIFRQFFWVVSDQVKNPLTLEKMKLNLFRRTRLQALKFFIF